MDSEEAVMLVLKDAARVVFPGSRINIVSRIRRDFAKHGSCDHSLIQNIEEILRNRLSQWSLEEKRGIWESLPDLSHDEDRAFDNYPEDSIDLTLEGELLWLITEELSPPRKSFARDDVE